MVALVSSEDADRVLQYRWCLIGGRLDYACRTDYSGEKKATIYLHRFVLEAPRGLQVDHINHVTLDNRRSNLRVCTLAENVLNRIKQKRNTSGYKGVYWLKSKQIWRVVIISGGKSHFFGYFHDVVEAAKAYDRGAIQVHGQFASLNFPA